MCCRMLGFNSIRVAFAFDDVGGINSPPVDWSSNVPCDVPTQTQIRSTLKPGAAATTTLEKNSNSLPPLAPPEVTNGVCNNDWPQDSTYQRFVWVVQYLISEVGVDSLEAREILQWLNVSMGAPSGTACRLWSTNIHQLFMQGFYVMLDFHANR